MSMGALFIAQAFGIDVPIATQIGLLAFMLISSNGAAGVSGAGLVTLAASLTAFDSVIPVAGIALIVGIDRFMSEGRALTNLTGNGLGTLVIARWTGELDRERLSYVLDNPTSVDVDEWLKDEAPPTVDSHEGDEAPPRAPPRTPPARPRSQRATPLPAAGSRRRRSPSDRTAPAVALGCQARAFRGEGAR